MLASKEEKVSLTYSQLEVLLRYLFKSIQIVDRLSYTNHALFEQLCKETVELPYISIKDVHDFIKHLSKEIGLDFPFKD